MKYKFVHQIIQLLGSHQRNVDVIAVFCSSFRCSVCCVCMFLFGCTACVGVLFPSYWFYLRFWLCWLCTMFFVYYVTHSILVLPFLCFTVMWFSKEVIARWLVGDARGVTILIGVSRRRLPTLGVCGGCSCFLSGSGYLAGSGAWLVRWLFLFWSGASRILLSRLFPIFVIVPLPVFWP